MTKKLEPCPFCGHEAKIKVLMADEDIKQVVCPNCGASNVWGDDAVKRWNNRKKIIIRKCPICGAYAECYHDYDSTWLVQCSKCYLTSLYKKTYEEAIEAWNRRPAQNDGEEEE